MEWFSFLQAATFKPHRLAFPDSWMGHIPFAGWIIKYLHPQVFVELGTRSGNSYLSFCQSVQEAQLDTKCYAIDTWKGDEQAGYYSEEIYTDLAAYHVRYIDFSHLLRMTFDEGVNQFADESIDLLHIDGLHTYDAVKHDFQTWLPKLTPNAVVMFHDIHVHEGKFGVWQLWDELAQKYPVNFDFTHSYGLGIIQLTNSSGEDFLPWIHLHPEYHKLVREYFEGLGNSILERYHLQEGISNLLESSDQKNDLIASLSEKDQIHSETIREQKARLLDLENSIRSLEFESQKMIADREKVIEQKKEELSRAEHQLQEYLSSSSWRITKPLRTIKSFISRRKS